MKKLGMLFGVVVVSVIVALMYWVFEYAVHHSITYIWDTVFDTTSYPLLIIPLCVGLSLIFFGLQHYLDPKSENHESHSLGGAPIKPSLKKIGVTLFIGYFSLVAGASLGPEAILVPATTMAGGFVALRLFKKNALATQAFTAAAIMALFTAFFHSYIIGILSVYLVLAVAKTKLNPQLLLIAVVSSVTSYAVLNLIDPKQRYFTFPDLTWKIVLVDIVVGTVLLVAGYLSTFALKYLHTAFANFRQRTHSTQWVKVALIASIGLSALYIIGGPLVEFTGNKSIQPLLSQAPGLGISGVLIVLIVKLVAIAWSKAMGYRGGLIFPMVFVASTLVVISQLVVNDMHFGAGIVAAMIGVLAAERKAKILL